MVTRPMCARRSPGRHRGFALIDVIIGGILLAIGLTAILSLGARSMNMHQRGEREAVAAALIDDLLSMVLADGPKDFPEVQATSGICDEPYGDYEYRVDIDNGGSGVPYAVAVTITHRPTSDTWVVETLIAGKLGEEPDPERAPPEPIDREERYREQEEAENEV
jgi:hypothetical protein